MTRNKHVFVVNLKLICLTRIIVHFNEYFIGWIGLFFNMVYGFKILNKREKRRGHNLFYLFLL